MKNININHKDSTIEITEAFEKRAEAYGSSSYSMLLMAQKDFPTYRIVVVKGNPTTKKYKGLDFGYIRKYLINHNDAVGVREFDKLIENKVGYFGIKKWFFERHPNFANCTTKTDLVLALD